MTSGTPLTTCTNGVSLPASPPTGTAGIGMPLAADMLKKTKERRKDRQIERKSASRSSGSARSVLTLRAPRARTPPRGRGNLPGGKGWTGPPASPSRRTKTARKAGGVRGVRGVRTAGAESARNRRGIAGAEEPPRLYSPAHKKNNTPTLFPPRPRPQIGALLRGIIAPPPTLHEIRVRPPARSNLVTWRLGEIVISANFNKNSAHAATPESQAPGHVPDSRSRASGNYRRRAPDNYTQLPDYPTLITRRPIYPTDAAVTTDPTRELCRATF